MGKVLHGTVVLTLIAVFASVGCMATPSWMASATDMVPRLGKKKTAQGFPLSGGPDFSKSYEDFSAEHQSRNVVAPAIGLNQDMEPGKLQRWSNVVTGSSVVNGVKTVFKTGAAKATDIVMPLKGPPPSAVSLATAVGQPTPDLFLSVARLHESSGNIQGAEQQYRFALEVAPENLAALLGCAHSCDRQGRLAEATKFYRQATEFHPTQAAPLNDLGLCLARQQKLSEATEALEKAIKLQPNRKLYRNNVATVLVELGRVDEAASHLAAVHGEAVAHNNVGYLLHKLGNTAAASRHYALASQIDPSLATARQTAGSDPRMTPWSRPQPDRAPIQQTAPALTDRQAVPNAVAPRYEKRVVPANPPRINAGRIVPRQATPAPVAPRGPVNLPHWSQSPDRQTHAAAPPIPGQTDNFPTVRPDSSVAEPASRDLLRHLPPVDPAYIPPSRY